MQEEEIEIENAEWGAVEQKEDKGEPRPSRNRNYRNRIMGPWTIGLATSGKVRFLLYQTEKATHIAN